jgi:hypothetical protein
MATRWRRQRAVTDRIRKRTVYGRVLAAVLSSGQTELGGQDHQEAAPAAVNPAACDAHCWARRTPTRSIDGVRATGEPDNWMALQ